MNTVVCFVVLAVVCFTTTESVGTRMRREHVEWWNALLEDFQRQVSRAMTSVVESCDEPQLLVNANLTRDILMEIQQIKSEITELKLESNTNLTQMVLEEIHQIKSELKQLTELDLGEGWKFPAFSCKEIAERKPNSSSGFYYLQNCASSSPVQVYCDMEKNFSLGKKGWIRVANLNMKDPNQQCPSNFHTYTQPKRLCGRSTDGSGCDSVKFTTNGLQYNKVCGRAVGYQFATPDGFENSDNINKAYVNGISITYSSPRKHIWTYAAGHYETGRDNSNCPCNSPAGSQPPSFVGNDYYCESADDSAPHNANTLFSDDALWDGEGCDGDEAPCCNHPDLPWFCKELPEPTSDDLEVRICTDEGLPNEDVPIEVMQLYLQ